MIGVTVIRTVVRYSYQVLFESVGQSALFDLRKDMYVKLQELDFDFFNHTRVGDIMARMTGDTDAIRHFVSWVTYNLLECIFMVHRSRDCDGDDQLAIDASINFNYTFDFFC